MLMTPKVLKILNQYERAHLHLFSLNITGEDSLPAMGYGIKFKAWGRAVSGRAFSNDHAFEITGSVLSNTGRGAISQVKRDDSYIRYTIRGPSSEDISYFSRVLYYLPYILRTGTDSGDIELLLAYVQRIEVGRIRKRKLVYKIKDSTKEFVDLMDVQELVGSIESWGKRYLVSKTSCFWPKKGFQWSQIVANDDVFDEDDE